MKKIWFFIVSTGIFQGVVGMQSPFVKEDLLAGWGKLNDEQKRDFLKLEMGIMADLMRELGALEKLDVGVRDTASKSQEFLRTSLTGSCPDLTRR